jgi:hypothetical protein
LYDVVAIVAGTVEAWLTVAIEVVGLEGAGTLVVVEPRMAAVSGNTVSELTGSYPWSKIAADGTLPCRLQAEDTPTAVASIEYPMEHRIPGLS